MIHQSQSVFIYLPALFHYRLHFIFTDKESLVSTVKKYMSLRRDYSKKYTANNTITAVRAMQQYLLTPGDLENLPQIKIRSPYQVNVPIYVYLEKDVENLAIKVIFNLHI